jgi:hypothetical protein
MDEKISERSKMENMLEVPTSWDEMTVWNIMIEIARIATVFWSAAR